jgi:hypothetical protein
VAELSAELQVGDVGHSQVDDQQGDGDGEDGVAEEQDPVVLDLPDPGQDRQRSEGAAMDGVYPPGRRAHALRGG